ncbi:MAG: LamG domain-containing protein [Planctomycetaceae bacterium]|nr:LamG domain-containing protein [Planctomycetaceae bacterium]
MTNRVVTVAVALVAIMVVSHAIADGDAASPKSAVVWNLDNLKQIGGHAVQVVGEPRVIEVDGFKAMQFDGKDDGIFLDVHPLAGAGEFTAEVVFRPDAGGPAEQRFFHMQENGSENRVMFETRVTKDGEWFLDTHIQSGEAGFTLFAEKHKHPVGRWYHAALVVDGKEMRHYVDGKLEMATPITYRPQAAGRTSLGVRQNKVFWFQGAIRTARFTRGVLEPRAFLRP